MRGKFFQLLDEGKNLSYQTIIENFELFKPFFVRQFIDRCDDLFFLHKSTMLHTFLWCERIHCNDVMVGVFILNTHLVFTLNWVETADKSSPFNQISSCLCVCVWLSLRMLMCLYMRSILLRATSPCMWYDTRLYVYAIRHLCVFLNFLIAISCTLIRPALCNSNALLPKVNCIAQCSHEPNWKQLPSQFHWGNRIVLKTLSAECDNVNCRRTRTAIEILLLRCMFALLLTQQLKFHGD